MLRLALATSRPAFTRSLASSVLLSRSWETQTVAQLRQETKSRGLASSGTKATLVQRLKTFEEKKAQEARAPTSVAPTARREASTTAAAPARPVTPVDPNIFNIKIPDLSQPASEIPVQVPFVPDFWDSAHNAVEPQLEGASPKLLVVAGATTHHGGGPSHNSLLERSEEIQGASSSTTTQSSSPSAQPQAPSEGGIFFDIAADLGFLNAVPPPKPAKKPFWQLFA